MFTKTQQIHKTVCEILGAKIFKKYSPFFGSIWNKYHINKNNIDNLNDVVDGAWENTRIHCASFATECVMYGICALINVNSDTSFIKMLGALAVIHGYAIMIQSYNILLAKKQLEYLVKHKEEIKETVPIAEELNFKPFSIQATGKYYTVNHRILFFHMTPYTINKDQVEKFLEYLLNNYNEKTILEMYFNETHTEIYNNWLIKAC